MYSQAHTVLQTHGKITYNGHSFKEFFPQRTAAYIHQIDTHLPELTVRETFDFAARSQGTGHKAGDWTSRICDSVRLQVLLGSARDMLHLDLLLSTLHAPL